MPQLRIIYSISTQSSICTLVSFNSMNIQRLYRVEVLLSQTKIFISQDLFFFFFWSRYRTDDYKIILIQRFWTRTREKAFWRKEKCRKKVKALYQGKEVYASFKTIFHKVIKHYTFSSFLNRQVIVCTILEPAGECINSTNFGDRKSRW